MQPDLAIDLGTSKTRIFVKNKGIVINEPSVITVNVEDGSVVAVGEEAYLMFGRTSARKNAVYPINGGVISDVEMFEAMIKTMLRHIVSSKIGMPRAVVCVPSETTEVEKSAIVNSISSVGIRKVCIIQEPVAAAIGAGLDISSPHGAFVVNIGGGTTDMAVISLGGIAVSRSIRHAGDVMDEKIIKYIRKTYNMLIGKRTAEQAKIKIGSVINDAVSGKYTIKGKSLLTGMPMKIDIKASELIEPLKDTADLIVSKIQDILLETPPELIGDIYTDGILLTGGSACLKGIDKLIQDTTELKVRIADDPANCVIKGCGEAINYIGAKPAEKGGINPIIAQY